MATITTRIGPADHGRRMSLEEFREADEEPGHRYELARGVIEVTEVPNDAHGLIVCNLYRLIARFEVDHPGLIYRYGGGSEFRIWLPGMESGRNPDLGVVLISTPRDARGRRPPSLVAEVVSQRSGERDYTAKRDEYLAFGIQEFWVVDPTSRRVVVLTRLGDSWVERICQGDDPIPSRLLPGFAGRVAGLWAFLDPDEEPGEG
ncbi:Uma2 family endonuclease [Tundrisphaera sp. TA3]|uniref:Uma2 family endonuclease n=1 Tax=Tundrisphaera sp. TA3 TaxID=3435775 RepID=UPI003EC01E9E